MHEKDSVESLRKRTGCQSRAVNEENVPRNIKGGLLGALPKAVP